MDVPSAHNVPDSVEVLGFRKLVISFLSPPFPSSKALGYIGQSLSAYGLASKGRAADSHDFLFESRESFDPKRIEKALMTYRSFLNFTLHFES